MVEQSKQEDANEGKKHPHLVTINVDDKNYEVRKGQWIVSELKAEVGVDPAKVLAKITPHGLKDFDDGEEIGVRDGERFMSHARSGGSS